MRWFKTLSICDKHKTITLATWGVWRAWDVGLQDYTHCSQHQLSIIISDSFRQHQCKSSHHRHRSTKFNNLSLFTDQIHLPLEPLLLSDERGGGEGAIMSCLLNKWLTNNTKPLTTLIIIRGNCIIRHNHYYYFKELPCIAITAGNYLLFTILSTIFFLRVF